MSYGKVHEQQVNKLCAKMDERFRRVPSNLKCHDPVQVNQWICNNCINKTVAYGKYYKLLLVQSYVI
jgi:ribosomal protein L37AE/L43A